MTNKYSSDAQILFKSLGLPDIQIHRSINHFDFTKHTRRILVIGSMGAGKTEYSARVWRDSQVALQKSENFARATITAGADRRKVFFIRSILDTMRFPQYPADALAYRGGYVRLGDSIAIINDSFGLETLMKENPQVGTWILDEPSFYDERLAYLTKKESEKRGLIFIFPSLTLNFRNEIFNTSVQLLLDNATDVFPLSAYCEYEDCMADSFFSYRYYRVNGVECPALYFDPLIIVGGDDIKDDPHEPNYCTRCDLHHYLPGKEYTYLILKPLGMKAASGDSGPLKKELSLLKEDIHSSSLAANLRELNQADSDAGTTNLHSLRPPNIAEKALIYLFMEQNLISEHLLGTFVEELALDKEYIGGRLADGGRAVQWH